MVRDQGTEFLAYLRGIETIFVQAIAVIKFVFLAYLRGIETLVWRRRPLQTACF